LVFASYLLFALACLLAVPVAVFFFEIIAALLLSARESTFTSKSGLRKRVAVIVPAHNEGDGILATIEDIRTQLYHGDRLLVVADNCSDDTATIASNAGAEVIERNQSKKIGKGYALDFALKHLSSDPPGVVICIDADCSVAEGTIHRLAIVCAATHRPIQALNSMTAGSDSSVNHRVAEFAWRVKNWVRPLGLSALHLPCQLMGTGMAFPWDLIRSVDLANGSLVEDVKLGLDLTKAGRPPLFCLSASVTSHFAASAEGASSQRRRWEEGSIRLILTTAPRLLYAAIVERNLGLLALTLDLMIPPLSLLMIMVVSLVVGTGVSVFYGFPPTALFISAACLATLVVAVFLSWVTYGRDILPLKSIFLVFRYMFAKVPMYRKILSTRSASPWLRTDRGLKP
jgi:cellulose synthase/poly-beta-1,6-N-acetylglucosamine synthase-like glycosyltransferase